MEEHKESVIMEIQESELTEMISINVICRLCANQNDKLIGIYSEDGINNDLANKMNLYLPVKVNETDDLPLQCCWQCASTVLAWHELVVTSVEADRRLRSYQFVTEKQLEDVELNFQTEPNLTTENKDECESIENYMKNSGDINSLYLHIQKEEKLKLLKTTADKSVTNTENETLNNDNNTPVECSNPSTQVNFVQNKANPTQINLEENLSSTEFKEQESLTNVDCEICEKQISSKANYLNHIKTHSNDFYCKACCNSYSSQYKLNLHLSQHLAQISKDCDTTQAYVKCEFSECEMMFPSKLQLFNHKKLHLNIKELLCNICGITFLRKSALEAHIKKYVDILTCAVCKKQFANKKTLREHERLHTGELPFQCKQCDEKFRCHSGLKYHEAKHSSERKFRCNQCNLSFARSNYLKDHMRRHLNERPYSCSFCNSKFIQRNVLKRHVTNVHRNCSICKNTIGNVRDYRAHMYTEHNILLKSPE